MGSVTLPVTILERDLIVEIEYTVAFRGYPATRDEPAGGPEYDWALTGLFDDPRPAAVKIFTNGKYIPVSSELDMPRWLSELIADTHRDQIHFLIDEEETGA